jgi:BolA protein
VYGNIEDPAVVGLIRTRTGGTTVQPTRTTDEIREAIERGLDATHVEVIDHSASHAGHPGAANGGHFEVVVVSDRFRGLSRLAVQRLVYEALGKLMQTEIHALSMHTFTPDQWRSRTGRGSE